MVAKRGSPFWVFAGGCLTGAALLGLHSSGGPEAVSSAPRADRSNDTAPRSTKASSVEDRAQVAPVATEVAARAIGEASDTAERDKAETGNSVAEVLARLETEYRERSTPAPAPAKVLPASDEPGPASSNEPPQAPSADNAASAANPAASEPAAVVRAAARPAEAPPSSARLATLSVDDKPLPAVAEEAAQLASIRDQQAKTLERGQEQLAQMQQLAALQQAALVEQYTLFQLQLLSQSPVAQRTVALAPSRPQRRGKERGGRIIASLPSSISATDNPWGFDLQPSELVR